MLKLKRCKECWTLFILPPRHSLTPGFPNAIEAFQAFRRLASLGFSCNPPSSFRPAKPLEAKSKDRQHWRRPVEKKSYNLHFKMKKIYVYFEL